MIAERALEFGKDGDVVGLGTGRAASGSVHALGRAVAAGLRVRGIPTSQATADLARQLGIPLTSFEEVETIDVAVDGADEVAPNFDLIKGRGGALLREKIVATAARRLVILVGKEKCVPVLGSHGLLPIEVAPFGAAFCQRRLASLGVRAELRTEGSRPYVTDNGNYVFQGRIAALADAKGLDSQLRAIPGVVATGLFLDMADT